ncbi:MAG: hypothetical protein C0617_13385 [Desulfuromonas sp.]|nr:MAG: hypothetical protein C0617_13385 [Desulfuromonas sp.]
MAARTTEGALPIMKVITHPYTEKQWRTIDALGEAVDRRLAALKAGLTMGGEPTFVCRERPEAAEWRTDALGEGKRGKAERRLLRLKERLPPGGLLHYGVGKWYPGEAWPRWALGYYWRQDGVPVWRRPDLLSPEGDTRSIGPGEGRGLIRRLAENLAVNPARILEIFQGPERQGVLPVSAGFVLPLLRVDSGGGRRWASCSWALPPGPLLARPGDAPLGLRLPLADMEWPEADGLLSEAGEGSPVPAPGLREEGGYVEGEPGTIRVALAVEALEGALEVFLPPVGTLEGFLHLVEAVEQTAGELDSPVRLGGYPPPIDPALSRLGLVPDPGVLEVNLPPARSWVEIREMVQVVYREAEACHLDAFKFQRDGRIVGTGGGSHLTLGGGTALESPFSRRPDLLRSFLSYWQNHPGLSYGFSGLFVGPTSQTPRVDEARHESLYELELAFLQLERGDDLSPEGLDRVFRHILVDLTGNSHRAEFCIDKLFPADNPAGRLGLLELRCLEMPPHPRMSLALALLVRSLLAWFLSQPFQGPLVRWGTALHDRFALPHFIAADLARVAKDLRQAGYPYQDEWLQPFLDFRFPHCGTMSLPEAELELRQALEPWPVLGPAAHSGAASRPVDSSCERLQARLRCAEGHPLALLCNEHRVPLAATGVEGESVGGVRFKAWPLVDALHPGIEPHVPLLFEVVHSGSGKVLGSFEYHVGRPGRGDYPDLPEGPREAERRWAERVVLRERGGPYRPPSSPEGHPACPYTLDLRQKKGGRKCGPLGSCQD